MRDPTREQNPILVGRDNRLVQDLVKIGRADLPICARAKVSCRSCRARSAALTATVVAGADAAGTEAASRYLARHVPYVWDNRRGRCRSRRQDRRDASSAHAAGAGQAAQALAELDAIARELSLRREVPPRRSR